MCFAPRDLREFVSQDQHSNYDSFTKFPMKTFISSPHISSSRQTHLLIQWKTEGVECLFVRSDASNVHFRPQFPRQEEESPGNGLPCKSARFSHLLDPAYLVKRLRNGVMNDGSAE
jgi:hypothetical protein